MGSVGTSCFRVRCTVNPSLSLYYITGSLASNLRSIMMRLQKFCFCCSVRTGTIVLAVLGTISPLLSLIGLSIQFHGALKYITSALSLFKQEEDSEHLEYAAKATSIVIGIFSVLIIIYAIDTLIGILAVVGAVKKRKNFLMPWIVTQGIAVCLSVCLLITVMAISASWNILQIAATIGMLLALLSNVYFFLVVWSHYQDLRDQALREANAPAEMQTRLTSQM